MLDQFDVKSKVQQAIADKEITLDTEFNKIVEETTPYVAKNLQKNGHQIVEVWSKSEKNARLLSSKLSSKISL